VGPSSRVLSWLTSALCILATALFGLVGGIAVATRVLSPSVMGVDQLASALGGFSLGGLAGLIVGIVLSRLLSPSRRVLAAVLAFFMSAATMWYLQHTRPIADPGSPRAVRSRPILA